MWVNYGRIGREKFFTDVYPGEHPMELRERLKAGRYDFRPGDMELERCPECGLPLEVARYKWDLSRGTITDPDTGRRVSIFGPKSVDAIFEDLRNELGEAVTSKATTTISPSSWRMPAYHCASSE